MMGYRVIGSPTDSGSVSLGSSPSTPAKRTVRKWFPIRGMPSELVRFRGPVARFERLGQLGAPLCSGLARRPLKAVARVRIPSGLLIGNARLTRATAWSAR